MQNIAFLKGTQVYLRPYAPETDAAKVHQWFNDPEVTHFMVTGRYPTTELQARALLEAQVRSEEHVVFVVVDSATEKPLGLVGLYDMDMVVRKAEMRIIIGEKEYWGKGVGTEAVELITYYGFDRLQLNKVYLGVMEENIKAVKAYEKAGFAHEGVLKDDLFRNSRYYDCVNMALLRKDYYPDLFKKYSEKFSIN